MLRSISAFVVCTLVGILLPHSALAQITTGTVTGRVIDPSGAVVPNASVILISETRGTRSATLATNSDGDYVFPNVTADRYTVEVTAAAFKVVKRTGVVVSGAEGFSYAYFTGALGDADQHYVHDTDTADNQSDDGNYCCNGD